MSPLAPHRERPSGCRAGALLGVVLLLAGIAAGWYLRSGGLPDPRSLVPVGVATSTAPATETPPPLPPPGHLGAPPAPRDVYPHIVLGGSGAPVTATHEFAFEGRTYEVSLEIDRALYRGAVNAERLISAPPGETTDERYIAYYRFLAQDTAQAPLIAELGAQLRRAAKEAKLDRDRYAEFVAKYVQTMPYDFGKLDMLDASARFPVETLVDGTGVCSDKSLLMAAILAHEGYDVALLLFEREQHMALGIKGPGEHYNSTGYLFVETTSPTYLAEIPDNFVSGISLESDPLVIPIGTGDRIYGSAERTERILGTRSSAREAADTLRTDAEKRPLTRAEADEINARLKVAYDAQLKLSVVEDHEAEFLDSAKAIDWIERECWWD